jgi:hypothetical protein
LAIDAMSSLNFNSTGGSSNSANEGCNCISSNDPSAGSTVQHATNPDRRNRQSVAMHLMSLCASLEFEMSGINLRTMIGNWTHRDYPLLVPRPDHYPITVRTVTDETDDKRAAVVEEIARSTWSAWSLHHDEIRTSLVNHLTQLV